MERHPLTTGRRQEQRFWSDLINAQLDSWEPRALPASFRPPRAQKRRDGRAVPFLAIAVTLLLLAIAFVTGQPRELVRIVVEVARPRPSATGPERTLASPHAARTSNNAVGGARSSPAAEESPSSSPGPPVLPPPTGTPGPPAPELRPMLPGLPSVRTPLPSLPADTPSPTPSLPVDTPTPLPSLPPSPSVPPPPSLLPLPSTSPPELKPPVPVPSSPEGVLPIPSGSPGV